MLSTVRGRGALLVASDRPRQGLFREFRKRGYGKQRKLEQILRDCAWGFSRSEAALSGRRSCYTRDGPTMNENTGRRCRLMDHARVVS